MLLHLSSLKADKETYKQVPASQVLTENDTYYKVQTFARQVLALKDTYYKVPARQVLAYSYYNPTNLVMMIHFPGGWSTW